MTAERRIAAAFGLDDEGWARHANPWSGWTRFVTCLPLLALAVWSRVWLGWWALAPVALALLWIALNPRAFPPARDDRSWIAQGVLGERLWAQRDRIAPPAGWRGGATAPTVAAAAGCPLLVWGLAALETAPTLLGMALVIGGKLWFIDRMAELYRETVAARPGLRYRRPGDDPDAAAAPGGRRRPPA